MKIEMRNIEYGNQNFHLNVDHIMIEDGSITGIGGPNGSGKSTLLKILYGYLKPIKGTVLIDGNSLNELRGAKVAGKISVVQQETPTPMNFTVENIVSMSRYSDPVDDSKVRESLDRCGIAHLQHRKFEELSGGERRLVMIAGALYQGTEIIMLDEPTTFLDVDKELRIVDLIVNLKQLGKTVIVVLHDVNLLYRICNRVIMMRDGRVMGEGYPSRMFTPDLLREVYGSSFLSFTTPDGITWMPYNRYGEPLEEILVIEDEFPRLGLSYNLWKNGMGVASFSVRVSDADLDLQLDEIRHASQKYRYAVITSRVVNEPRRGIEELIAEFFRDGKLLFLVDSENESSMVSVSDRENYFRIFGVEKTVADICHEIKEITESTSLSYGVRK
jgi:iron complex transport system ATP-binding protein